MKTAIISVGTEILFGQIVNTNTVYISRQLQLLGFDVLYHHSVGDNYGRLNDLLETTFEDCDLIITTGGLGPTEDDMTKDSIAHVMEDELVQHGPTVEKLRKHSTIMGRKLTPNNIKQAVIPSRSHIFPNDVGSAIGFAVEKNGKHIISMPGPPSEMTHMFDSYVIPYLESFQDSVIYYRILRTYGIGESILETDLLDIIDEQTDPTIATYAKEGECTVRVASKRKTLREAQEAVFETIKQIYDRVGDHIYSDNDEELVSVVGNLLIDKGITISCAESCTGGYFARELTSVPGISKVFDRGIVTYTERAKMEELGVLEETIREHTVYSPEVAGEMARGLWDKTGSDICISVTGVAGPGTEGTDFVPGTAFVGLCYHGKCDVKMIKGRDKDRDWNRHYLVLGMLHMIYELVS